MGNQAMNQPTLAQRAVDSIEDFAGRHPGHRRAHAKGACYRGEFTPNPEAARYTTAVHFQEERTPVIVRFSNSSPDPSQSDLLSPAKGIAVQFQLPDGEVTNLVAVSIPVFFARTPESFVDILKMVTAFEHKELSFKEKVAGVIEHFGESRHALLEVAKLKPPTSYAELPYYSIHAFFMVNAEGVRRPIKYEWEPDADIHHLSAAEAKEQSPDYLETEFSQRIRIAPAGFTLKAVLGEEDDPTDDSTQKWPDKRERIILGHLTITEATSEPENLVMDPTVVTSGIELSNDPILNFRHEAYAISHHRRSLHE
ncbi:catalase [Paenibacillus shirakamiensis]|uniref:Catalase-related peroxidase n=1 Tax=Paenibacillus shirakamiensis TaxID=1265935 RepID=A0ABS4JIG3_9BACL|nr:catalase family peroxidase [Paenibacillus shirakamiensis]MBP2000354.1 catalase [Paenibacillus shirakamiensis]